MGKCKVNDTFLGKFTWARRIPGDLFHVKCNVCAISKPVSVEKGAQSWTQHENTAAHKAALEMGGASARTIERCLARSVDIGTATRKATILHVLNLVLHKHSFRSSDPFSRKQVSYAKMFPDSAFTSINCGKTNSPCNPRLLNFQRVGRCISSELVGLRSSQGSVAIQSGDKRKGIREHPKAGLC